MSPELNSREAIARALRDRIRVGEGLSVPYARKWAIGGCEARHSLWQYPHDAISDFATGLTGLNMPSVVDNEAVVVDTGRGRIWVGVNGNSRSADRASDFLVGQRGNQLPALIVNSPEVVIELLRAHNAPPVHIPAAEIVQVGFPGILDERRTYVGSWQWNIHGEAHGEEFVCRAAHATLTAIRAKEAQDGE